MTRLQQSGLFGPVLAVDFSDGRREYQELEPDALRQRKNDIRDGLVEGVVRFAILEPRRGKMPEWRARTTATPVALESSTPKNPAKPQTKKK